VKSPREIWETLDTEGTLDGLPFMPEMLEYCGLRAKVARRAEKTCMEFPGGSYRFQEFRGNDVVLLDGLRCSGSNHDGCQRACVLFWKEDWLREVKTGKPENGVDRQGGTAIASKLKTATAGGRYFCQSTQLAQATQPMPKIRILAKCLADIRSGSRGFFEMAWIIVAALWGKLMYRLPRRRLAGDLKRTPVGDLNLQPGEWVEIKSAPEIAQTLDDRGRNRGLLCDFGMCELGGRPYRVRSRLDRMISESTGEMRRVESTVILEGLNCLCPNVLGGCPRQDFMYWREVWLKRAGTSAMPANATAGGCSQQTNGSAQ
jgi:hypothetical protein